MRHDLSVTALTETPQRSFRIWEEDLFLSSVGPSAPGGALRAQHNNSTMRERSAQLISCRQASHVSNGRAAMLGSLSSAILKMEKHTRSASGILQHE